jgi:hypothetical protein
MASFSMRVHRESNAMSDVAKIPPRVLSTCTQDTIPSLLIGRNCKVLGDVAKISPPVPSTHAQNAILSLLIVHIIPSVQFYVASDNPSLVRHVSSHTTSSYLGN